MLVNTNIKWQQIVYHVCQQVSFLLLFNKRHFKLRKANNNISKMTHIAEETHIQLEEPTKSHCNSY